MRPGICRATLIATACFEALGWSQQASAETVLRRGNGAEIESLDPAKQETIAGLHVVLDAYQGLTDVAPDGNIRTGVAERWEVSLDGKTYTFYLRANARWSNGDPLTADDYVYSWIRALDPATKSPFAFSSTRSAGRMPSVRAR